MESPADASGVRRAMQLLGFGRGAGSARYLDEEGELCTLVEATFADFVATAKDSPSGHRVFKLEFVPATVAAVLPHLSPPRAPPIAPAAPVVDEGGAAAVEEDADPSPQVAWQWQVLEREAEEDWQMLEASDALPPAAAKEERFAKCSSEIPQEILDEIEHIKAACEAELLRHLEEWLAADPQQPTYEDWIASVHPENASEVLGTRVVDARLYLEDSFHRLLWNVQAENLPGLAALERLRRHVPAPGDAKGEPEAANDAAPPGADAPTVLPVVRLRGGSLGRKEASSLTAPTSPHLKHLQAAAVPVLLAPLATLAGASLVSAGLLAIPLLALLAAHRRSAKVSETCVEEAQAAAPGSPSPSPGSEQRGRVEEEVGTAS